MIASGRPDREGRRWGTEFASPAVSREQICKLGRYHVQYKGTSLSSLFNRHPPLLMNALLCSNEELDGTNAHNPPPCRLEGSVCRPARSLDPEKSRALAHAPGPHPASILYAVLGKKMQTSHRPYGCSPGVFLI